MRPFTLLTVLLFFSLLGCRGTDHSTPPPDTGKPDARGPETVRYKNVRFGFAVRVPSAWTFADDAENGDGIRIEIPDLPGARLALYGSLNVWDVRNLGDLVALYRDLDAEPDLHATRIRVGGLPGIELLEEKERVSVVHRLLLRGNTIDGLYLEAPPEVLTRARQALDQVASTFEAVDGLDVTP